MKQTLQPVGPVGNDASVPATIVIATANRPRLVLDCIESFRGQVPGVVDLIVVDAGTDAPVDRDAVAILWRNSRVIRVAERNASEQRNEGVRQGTSQVVIFLDDDTLVNLGWWPKILEPFAEPNVAVVQGGVHSSPHPARLRSARGGYVKWNGFVEPCLERGVDAPRELQWPLTTNMAVRKAVYESIGGLDPFFVVYDEDVDFGLRVRRAGWRIVHEPAAAVYHYGHQVWRPSATKASAFRRGRNRTYMLARNYGMAGRVWIYIMVYPFVAFWTAVTQTAGFAVQRAGHAIAEVIGTFCGLYTGLRHVTSAPNRER